MTNRRSTLDTEAPGYLYVAMADALTKRIAAGELEAGVALPNERSLAVGYGVSLGTARNACRVLRERGLLMTVPAKETYVTSDARWQACRFT